MSCQTSPSEVAAVVAAASGLYAVTAIPLMRLARADHLTPRCVRELPDRARELRENTALTTAALLLLLTAPKGATR